MNFIGGSKTCFRVFQTSFSQLSCLDCFNRRPVLYKLLFIRILEIPVPPHLTSFFCPSLCRCQYLFLTLLFLHRWKSFIRTWIHSCCHCGSPPLATRYCLHDTRAFTHRMILQKGASSPMHVCATDAWWKHQCIFSPKDVSQRRCAGT